MFDAYAINNFTNSLVSVDPATGDFEIIAPLSGDLDGSTGFQHGGEIINCTYYATNGTNVYEVDLVTGVSTPVIITGPGFTETFTGLEVDPTTGIFYAVSGEISANAIQSTLWQLDLVNGTITQVGSPLASACAISLVINSTGEAFYIDICSNDIYQINLNDGQFIGPRLPIGIDLNTGQDYSFGCAPGSNQVFGYAIRTEATVLMQYISIDLDSGETTIIQDFGIDQIGSLAFCKDNTTTTQTIPTLSQWSLIILSLILLIVSVVSLQYESLAHSTFKFQH